VDFPDPVLLHPVLLQPFVTTGGGGGALPLPTKQPAKLNDATTKANANATFFTGNPPLAGMLTAERFDNYRLDSDGTSAKKTHFVRIRSAVHPSTKLPSRVSTVSIMPE
jgi:hypothetical protein